MQSGRGRSQSPGASYQVPVELASSSQQFMIAAFSSVSPQLFGSPACQLVYAAAVPSLQPHAWSSGEVAASSA